MQLERGNPLIYKTILDISSDQNLSTPVMIDRLLEICRGSFGADAVGYGGIDDVDHSLYRLHSINQSSQLSFEAGITLPVKDVLCNKAIESGELTYYEDCSTSDVSEHPFVNLFAIHTYLGAPILSQGKLPRTLFFLFTQQQASAFSDAELDLIKTIAAVIETALARDESLVWKRRRLNSLQAMQRLANIGFWEVDVQSGKVYWSDQTRFIHEVPDDFEPNLETAIDFYKEGEDRQQIVDAVERGFEKGESWSLEVRLITYTGKEKWVAALGEAEFKDGECVRLFGAFQDIDAQVANRNLLAVKKQEAENLLQARSQLIAKISHELRTPINGISGMLQTIHSGLDKDILETKIAIAMQSSETLVRLINDVLDYSKIDSGELLISPAPLSLARVFNDLQALYLPLCEKQGIQLEFETHYCQQDWVEADEVRVKQIFTNILNNALRYTFGGHIKFTITTIQTGALLELVARVADSGKGMTREQTARIFKPFQQFDNQANAGTGLGLSIVKELCQAMHGDISVHSHPGAGSEFTVSLKFPYSEQANITARRVASPSVVAQLQGMKVLVVEDNEINRIVMEAMLSELSLTADYAVNGLEAIKTLKQNRDYNVVFMDCEMDVMDGFQATRKIRRELGYDHKSLTIIAMTANTTNENRQACFNVGMNAFLTKPVSVENIRDTLLLVSERKFH